MPDVWPVAELVTAAANGDVDAWNELVERFAGMVWAVARSHRLSAADAADVSQTTWLRLVEHLGRIEQPDRVGAWLATTARNESLRVLRMAKRTIPSSDEAVFSVGSVDDVSADTRLLTDERDGQVWAVFNRLPVRCQLILRLLIGEEALSYRDLAQALEMPIGSIGPTRARCLEHLRRLATSSGIFLEEGPS
ncbi:MAG: sigma-70 family RNA polymerase sigma factor [Acidimicrobiia bacterium]